MAHGRTEIYAQHQVVYIVLKREISKKTYTLESKETGAEQGKRRKTMA